MGPLSVSQESAGSRPRRLASGDRAPPIYCGLWLSRQQNCLYLDAHTEKTTSDSRPSLVSSAPTAMGIRIVARLDVGVRFDAQAQVFVSYAPALRIYSQ